MTDAPIPQPRHIAIVKLSSLGDVVHALPVSRALRRAFPGAQLAWIVEEREGALLAGHPDLDQVVRVDTRRWRRLIRRPDGAQEVLRALRLLRARLRASRFDVALDLQGLLKSGVLTALTGAPARIGFSRERSRELNWLFTNRHVVPPRHAVHVVDQYLALLEPLGVPSRAPEFHVPDRPAAERRVEEWFAEQGIGGGDVLVALNPGAAREDKRWPIAHFRTLAEQVAADLEARPLLLWGPGELPLAERIREGLSAGSLLAPPTDLPELAALLRRCALLVAGDTGPLHLAAAVGTPCLGLFGPTCAERNGPYGAHCRALQSPNGRMAGLTPAVALAACRALLGARSSSS